MMHVADQPDNAQRRRRARNADEVRLTEHLIATARDRLAGRDQEGRELIDVRPRERVVLGVLMPRPRPVVEPAIAAGSVPYEPGVPADHLPASEMGLTALIEPAVPSISIHVHATFAQYLQHTPTRDQQLQYSGLADMALDEPPPNERLGDDANPSSNESGIVEAVPATPPPEPSEAQLAGLSPDAAAAVAAAVSAVQRPRPGAETDTQPRRRPAGDFFRPVYRRYDVEVEHELQVPVPEDARPHDHVEHAAYRAAIKDSCNHAEPQTTGQFAGALLVPMHGRSAMRIPRDTVTAGPDDYEAYLREHARQGWQTPLPDLSFRVTVQRTPDGPVRLSLTLVNDTPQPQSDRGFLAEASVYDAGFTVSVTGAEVVPSEYRLVERDYRTNPLVHAHGRFCCLDEDAFADTGELRTTTLPVHRQMVYESKPELQPSFAELVTDPVAALERIDEYMNAFADAWDHHLEVAVLDEWARHQCTQDRAAFADEMRRFRRGMRLIREDLANHANGLGAAFVRANEAFTLMNTRGGLDQPGPPTATTWRLFQIVYVVASLPALAARETPVADRQTWLDQRSVPIGEPQDLDELNVADVLWFPTGGGKSAALYGIIAVALFFDRLRGKHAGVSAMIRFPLRMLSVQQLERVLRLVAACETVRQRHEDPGEELRLGYWVGRSNTPNRITDPKDVRWRDVTWMARQSDEWKRANTVLPVCPYCARSTVTLQPDPTTVRLAHRCLNCGKQLPVDVTDDEIYRHLPAVLVCTVDKIASLAFNAHASHLTHGPAFRCPDHGYVTFAQGPTKRCLARDTCTIDPTDWQPVTIKDPAPALVIQDELHLLSEELGTFAAHYETLWQHLCIVGSGLPSKVLAATATISDYENQVRQLYALAPRRFPTDGWRDGESFYARRYDDLIRRVFVGALPAQMDVVQFALATGEAIRTEVARLTGLPSNVAASEVALQSTTPDQLPDLLFQYELQGYYCNRKTHADRVHARAERTGRRGHPRFQSVRLNGQTHLSEISDVIRRIEREDLTIPAENRLGSIAGTSLISHGIDLERLNLLFVLGMPSTVAYYVQASSRAGRTGVGLVFTALTRYHVRDRSVFHFFDVQHRYVNVLVEPVALNRFSLHGPRRTASGLLAAVLAQQWARDPLLLSGAAINAPSDLTWANTVRTVLTRLRANAEANRGPDPVSLAQEAVRNAYGLHATILDPHIASRFADTVDAQIDSLLASIEGAHEMLLSKSMRPRPPTSLRDVDATADFGSDSHHATQLFRFLGGSDYDDDQADYAVSKED